MEYIDILISLLSGVKLGSLYALMAMGLTIIWGIVRIFNFAHGAFYLWGAYVAWVLLIPLGLTSYYSVAIIITVVTLFLLGALMAMSVIQPILREPEWATNSILATLGIAIFSENLCLFIFGPRPKKIPPVFEGFVRFGAFTITLHEVIILTAAISSLVVTWLLIKKTKVGLAMQALAQDSEAASLMGINVNRMYIYAIGLGGAMAGVAGVLLGSIYFLTPTVGSTPLLISFIIVLFGGLGSIKGTLVASYIIGIFQTLISLFFGLVWSLPLLFLFLIAMLTLRPQGLMGLKEETVK